MLLEDWLARKEPAKKKRRVCVRYEQKAQQHALAYPDHTRPEDARWPTICGDVPSQFITGFGVFDHATSENAVADLKQACENSR